MTTINGKRILVATNTPVTKGLERYIGGAINENFYLSLVNTERDERETIWPTITFLYDRKYYPGEHWIKSMEKTFPELDGNHPDCILTIMVQPRDPYPLPIFTFYFYKKDEKTGKTFIESIRQSSVSYIEKPGRFKGFAHESDGEAAVRFIDMIEIGIGKFLSEFGLKESERTIYK